jgi:hypothetical protein
LESKEHLSKDGRKENDQAIEGENHKQHKVSEEATSRRSDA